MKLTGCDAVKWKYNSLAHQHLHLKKVHKFKTLQKGVTATYILQGLGTIAEC